MLDSSMRVTKESEMLTQWNRKREEAREKESKIIKKELQTNTAATTTKMLSHCIESCSFIVCENIFHRDDTT